LAIFAGPPRLVAREQLGGRSTILSPPKLFRDVLQFSITVPYCDGVAVTASHVFGFTYTSQGRLSV
jgi:hypothetical protein